MFTLVHRVRLLDRLKKVLFQTQTPNMTDGVRGKPHSLSQTCLEQSHTCNSKPSPRRLESNYNVLLTDVCPPEIFKISKKLQKHEKLHKVEKNRVVSLSYFKITKAKKNLVRDLSTNIYLECLQTH